MKSKHFHTRLFCECGWSHGGTVLSACYGKVCPRCGTREEEFSLRTVRWISTAVWYKPMTWHTGYWEPMVTFADDKLDFTGTCAVTAERAVLFIRDGQRFWLPRSQIPMDAYVRGTDYTIKVPRWLAERKGIA